jgi:hypothetical protein
MADSILFHAVIEDNNDPLKMGRVRVRIFGLHCQEKEISDNNGIPTDALPWAEPMLPGNGISGLGNFIVPVNGTHVFVFFKEGKWDRPIYIGSYPGQPSEKSNPKKGFNDPDGDYPLEDHLNEPDWNRLARGITKDTIVDVKNQNLDTTIEEPESFYKAEYPYNQVIETPGGIIMEMDSTPDEERFHLYHPSNSYLEINQNGDMVFRNSGDKWEITDGDLKTHIAGNEKHIVNESGNFWQWVGGKVDEFNVKVRTIFSGDDQNNYTDGKIVDKVTGQRMESTKGAKQESILGSVSSSVTGFFSRMNLGIRNTSIYGLNRTNSTPPNSQTSDTIVKLGRKGPLGRLMDGVMSKVDGVVGAIRDQMQGIMDVFNSIQQGISDTIATVMDVFNNVLKPITDVINEVTTTIDAVKAEIMYMKNLAQTVMNLPTQIMQSIKSYASNIINAPGTLMNSVLGQISALPSQINLLKSVMVLYQTATDLSFTQGLTTFQTPSLGTNLKNLTSGMQVTLPNWDILMNGITSYSMNALSSYPRSGLSSYTDGEYIRNNFTSDYYLDYTATSGSELLIPTYTQEGNMLDEVNELNEFMTTEPAAVFINDDGTFDMDGAIDYVCEQQKLYIEEQLDTYYGVSDLLSPNTIIAQNGGLMVDLNTLFNVGGMLIDSNITNYLTSSQLLEDTTTLLAMNTLGTSGTSYSVSPSGIDETIYDELLPHIGSNNTVRELVISLDVNALVLNYLEDNLLDSTPFYVLSNTIIVYVRYLLEESQILVEDYAIELINGFKVDLKTIMLALLSFENEMRVELANLLNIENDENLDEFPSIEDVMNL